MLLHKVPLRVKNFLFEASNLWIPLDNMIPDTIAHREAPKQTLSY